MLGRSGTFPWSQEVCSRPRCSEPGLWTSSAESQLETQTPRLCEPPASESAWSGGSGGVTLLQNLVYFRGCGWGGLQIPLMATGLRAPLAPSACLQRGCVLDKVFTYPWQSGITRNLSVVTFLIKINLLTFVCKITVLVKWRWYPLFTFSVSLFGKIKGWQFKSSTTLLFKIHFTK